ncbi:Retrovirus-related Pol polyprotein from transposon 17.6 [Trichinella pseudospiralis]|uniref:Retrovirus-related Pol polyprotein from transposon 17.6 n=1 Tax=Trichinella pseudospiralis TaxID=6337 RepID=A0A0V0YFE2_TRIPS|nr:Retrovirus-related Pol polyprotein from transposon 17.6 [Trichinella pseudospiralis]
MLFGLCNAPATFQRLMETVLCGLHWTTCMVYLDGIIVFSKDAAEHLEKLEEVFSRLQGAGLKIKPSKCYLFQERVKCLGHVVSRDGVQPDPEKIKTDECDKASLHLKARLTKQPVLTHPDFKIPFLVDTDANGDGLGAVLSQDIARKEHGNAGPGMGAKAIPMLLIRAKIYSQNRSRQFDVAEELQRTRGSGCTMAATARRIRLRSYLSAGQKTLKRRRAIKGIVQAVWPKHPYILHNNRQYSALKSEIATQSYMAGVDTSSAGDGTTEKSGYRTDMPVGGYKDTSRKMPDWKQQDAAESITTKRSVDDRTVPNESNQRRHNWTIPTDGAGKQIHLDGAGLLLKMARSIPKLGHDSQYSCPNPGQRIHMSIRSPGIPPETAEHAQHESRSGQKELGLPLTLLAYRTSVHESTGATPYRVLYGREATLPIDLMYGLPEVPLRTPAECILQTLQKESRRQKKWYDRRTTDCHFDVNDKVWLATPKRNKLDKIWDGPYRIVQQADIVYLK